MAKLSKGDTPPSQRTEREILLADTLICLRSYGVIHEGSLRGSPVVSQQWPHAQYYFTVCDNGGEYHIHRINSSTPGQSVPYDTLQGRMDAGTMAYRVQSVMRGEKIDWKLRFSTEEIQIMKEAA